MVLQQNRCSSWVLGIQVTWGLKLQTVMILGCRVKALGGMVLGFRATTQEHLQQVG
jgi:hypothetical protein